MTQDIDSVVRGWDVKPGVLQARLVPARDGRQVIQMRVDLGVLQIETSGRPDGARPHGQATFGAYLRDQARLALKTGKRLVMSDEQCQEADREFLQYYHRRVCWLALRHYGNAMADADHTLALMDFVRDHSPSEEYTQAHEQYRGFVVFQRTQAATALYVEKNDPEGAIDALRDGLERLRACFVAYDMEEDMDENDMVQHLRKVESSLREEYSISTTLRERLDQAVAAEDYELAAQLRDQLRQRS